MVRCQVTAGVDGSSPHTRGALRDSTAWLDAEGGSSPHTRGAHTTRHSLTLCTGIIPAYAGSTACRRRASTCRSDHPRIRGEHSGLPLAEWRRAGSSPHTRGARAVRHRPGGVAGIIPAYAGSTVCHDIPLGPVTDHPRIRGEHRPARCLTRCRPGSSPHTRGAPAEASGEDRLGGIIPAYAGSTRSARR